jgi:uncharacterized repeat protein (TIGR03803 family)
MAVISPAQTLTTLWIFDFKNGAFPYANLVQATNGYLYGTTNRGGVHSQGTVFQITPAGDLTGFYSFCSLENCADGSAPFSTLVQAANGDLYGTTWAGGSGGYGTIFLFSPDRTLTSLYSFCSNCATGDDPYAGLAQADDGELYGTTEDTVFKITPSGTLTTLYTFCSLPNCADGVGPVAVLVQAANGNFYGTTQAGGANCQRTEICGTIFQITPDGALTTLYSFCSLPNCADGAGPLGLVQAANGDLYGTTSYGGAKCQDVLGCGTVFKLSQSGALTTLYSFCSVAGCPDGEFPAAGFVQATDGNLYGPTQAGGAHYLGTLFKFTPGGTLTSLYSFCSLPNCADGSLPYGGLIQVTNGDLYGTTNMGGPSCAGNPGGCGTVFSFSVGLGPFVEPQTTSGAVGSRVKILGTGLTGATKVTFDGTAATFDVVSASLITATVPAGATTGPIQVVTPGSTLSSNVPFRVRP